jgi:hypothetical protein
MNGVVIKSRNEQKIWERIVFNEDSHQINECNLHYFFAPIEEC